MIKTEKFDKIVKKKKKSFLGRLFWYFRYRNIMAKHVNVLNEEFNMKSDLLMRFYTVVNILPEEYDINKGDAPKIKVMEYLNKLKLWIQKKGLLGLCVISNVSEIDQYNYLIIIEFAQIKISKFINKIIIISIISLILLIIGSIYLKIMLS